MYPLLSEFANTITSLIGSGERKVLLDLSTVTYVDSATIGCLMDLYRQATAAGGALKLAGVQKRVETMLTMTGAQNFLEIHAGRSRRPSRASGASVAMRTIKTTTGADIAARRRSARDHGDALPEVTARRELERSFEDMISEIKHLIDQMDGGRAPRLPAREPVPQHREVRERQARSVHEEDHEVARSGSRPRAAETRKAAVSRGLFTACCRLPSAS